MPTKKRKKRTVNIRNLAIVVIGLVLILGAVILLAKILFGNDKNPKASVETIPPEDVQEVQEAEEEQQKEDESSAKQADEDKVSLFLCGDGLLHESVYMDAMNDDGSFNFAKQLDRISSIAEKYDLQYYNQETILGGTELGLSGYPTFNSPLEFGTYMVKNGFNLVSTANNHCLDMGWQGVVNSRKFWNAQKGVLMQGTNTSQAEYDETAVMEVNGIKIAFLSYCEHTNGINPDYSYEVNYFPGYEQEMLAKVRKAKEENDVVIIAMHWGTEYSYEVNDTQRSLARQLAEAGADVIVGNHVHVIEPFEWIGDSVVFYAMGNLISTQIDVENRIGMIAGMDLVRTTNSDGSTSVKIENLKADLHFTYTEGEYPALRTNVQVYPFWQLDDSILPGYADTYKEFKSIITALDSNIQIGGF